MNQVRKNVPIYINPDEKDIKALVNKINNILKQLWINDKNLNIDSRLMFIEQRISKAEDSINKLLHP